MGCDACLTGGCSLQASSTCGGYPGDQVLAGYGGRGAADVDVGARDSCAGAQGASAGVEGSGALGISVGLQEYGVLLAMEHDGTSRMWSVELLVSEVSAVDVQGLRLWGAETLHESWV